MYFKQFKDMHGAPDYPARGVAIRVCVGVAPVIPLKTAIIVTSTLILSGSTVAGMCFAWRMGDFLLPGRAAWQ